MTNTISKVRASSAFLALTFVLAMGSAGAKDVSVKLTGAEETPPVMTTASGTGKFTIGDDKSVTGSIKTTGMDGTAAHIHLAAPGKSGPPIIPLMKGDKDIWNAPDGAKLTDDQFASFKAGDLYVNVHSEAHKDGEIRAQLKP